GGRGNTARGPSQTLQEALAELAQQPKQRARKADRMLSGDQLHFVHCLPRRTRLKVPRRRRDRAYFTELGRRLAALSGVERVTVTPETASIVVHHAPYFRWSTVRLEAMGLHAVAPPAASTRAGLRDGDSSLVNAILWLVKVLWSGQVLAHVLELLASALVRHALNDLLRAERART